MRGKSRSRATDKTKECKDTTVFDEKSAKFISKYPSICNKCEPILKHENTTAVGRISTNSPQKQATAS